jgi:hypothetical protein
MANRNPEKGKDSQMASSTTIKIPKKDIEKAFSEIQLQVLRKSDLDRLFSGNQLRWKIPDGVTAASFINYLLSRKQLVEVKFQFPRRTEMRYTWGEVSELRTILSLRANSYFSHQTAMFLNKLIEPAPKTIYVNSEQPAKRNPQGMLEQKSIDVAFSNQVRQTKMRAAFKDYEVCLLNGKFTDQLGVEDYKDSSGERIRATNIERTLIDITVRPAYAGGVVEVLKAYKTARPKVSIDKLVLILKQLDYVYPYHQAIGFYMASAGVYGKSEIALLRAIRMEFDFYLTYQMTEKEYSEDWQIYFPKGFNI